MESGGRGGLEQEPVSYRNFAFCRSGKLRFHRSSRRDRDRLLSERLWGRAWRAVRTEGA